MCQIFCVQHLNLQTWFTVHIPNFLDLANTDQSAYMYFIVQQYWFIVPQYWFIVPQYWFIVPQYWFILPQDGFIVPHYWFIVQHYLFIVHLYWFIVQQYWFIVQQYWPVHIQLQVGTEFVCQLISFPWCLKIVITQGLVKTGQDSNL